MNNYNVTFANAPCANCDRKGCGVFHSQCADYVSWKAQQDLIKHNIRIKREKDTDYNRFKYAGIVKAVKKKNQ